MRRREKHDGTTERQRATEDGGSVMRGEVKDDHGRTLYFARRPLGYNGEDLDRGQIVAFTGQRNDEKLIRLGYVLSLLPGDSQFQCRKCAAKFIDQQSREWHGQKRHEADDRPEVPFSPRGATVDDTAAASQQYEREQAEADQRAPLNLEKSQASTARA
jgi:hypothetical protein